MSLKDVNFRVFYTPTKLDPKFGCAICPQVVDMATLNDKQQLVGLHSGETQEQLILRYPGILVGMSHDVQAEREAMMKSEPTEVSEDVFIEALECLPPEDWHNKQSSESFKMCEYLSGQITSIYCRIGKRYFSFTDVATLTHDEIRAKVMASMQQTQERATEMPVMANQNH